MNEYLIWSTDGKCIGSVFGDKLSAGPAGIYIHLNDKIVGILPLTGFAVTLKKK